MMGASSAPPLGLPLRRPRLLRPGAHVFFALLLTHGASAALNVRLKGRAAAGAGDRQKVALAVDVASSQFPFAPVLSPNTYTGRWEFSPAGMGGFVMQGAQFGMLPMMPMFPGMAPAPARAAAPAPAPGPAAGPAPAVAHDVCEQLTAAVQGGPGQLISCQSFNYYGDGALAAPPSGCHCSAFTHRCPFEACTVTHAWEENCLEPPAAALGFTALSKAWYEVRSIEESVRGVVNCMYWLPKARGQTMPPMVSKKVLPKYANLRFEGANVLDCMKAGWDERSIAATKFALVTALGEPSITVFAIGCGSFHATVYGPADAVDRAKMKMFQPGFCFTVASLNPPPKFCVSRPHAPAAAPSPFGAPAPRRAPGGAPAPAPKAAR